MIQPEPFRGPGQGSRVGNRLHKAEFVPAQFRTHDGSVDLSIGFTEIWPAVPSVNKVFARCFGVWRSPVIHRLAPQLLRDDR